MALSRPGVLLKDPGVRMDGWMDGTSSLCTTAQEEPLRGTLGGHDGPRPSHKGQWRSCLLATAAQANRKLKNKLATLSNLLKNLITNEPAEIFGQVLPGFRPKSTPGIP